MLSSSKKPALTPHPSQRLAARAASKGLVRHAARTASTELAPVLAFDDAAGDPSLPTSGPGLFVEVYSDVFTALPIPLTAQVAPTAVSAALNYTQDYWDNYDNPLGLRPPLFELAAELGQFTLLFYGAPSSLVCCCGTFGLLLAVAPFLLARFSWTVGDGQPGRGMRQSDPEHWACHRA